MEGNFRHFEYFAFLTYYWEHFGSLEGCPPFVLHVFGCLMKSVQGLSSREQDRPPHLQILNRYQIALWLLVLPAPRPGYWKYIQPISPSECSSFWLLRAFVLSKMCVSFVSIVGVYRSSIHCLYIFICMHAVHPSSCFIQTPASPCFKPVISL